MEKASANGLDHKELQELAKELSKSPGGITGLARATMALTVIMILAVAVIHVLVEYCQKDNSQIVGNILSMLGGLLAAITGFYFGGRTAAEATEKAKG
jgi:Na+/H+-translocating membrane pyrophosphatase